MAKPSEEEAKKETLRHNARQIEIYAHAIRPMLEPGSSPDAYVDGRGKKQKGESRMAIADAGLDLLEDEGNYEAWTKLEPLIDRLRSRRTDYWLRIERCRDGSWWSWVVAADDEEARWEKGYLREACRRLAEEFAKAHGDERRLQIDLNPKRRKETSHEPAESVQKAHLQHLADKKRWDAQDRWREICAEIGSIKEARGCGVEEAIRAYRARRKEKGKEDISPATIYRALAFCGEAGEAQGVGRRSHLGLGGRGEVGTTKGDHFDLR